MEWVLHLAGLLRECLRGLLRRRRARHLRPHEKQEALLQKLVGRCEVHIGGIRLRCENADVILLRISISHVGQEQERRLLLLYK